MAFTQSDLEVVEQAIRDKMTGGAIQAYSIGDRAITHMRLSELLELKREMQADIAASSAQGTFVLARLRPK